MRSIVPVFLAVVGVAAACDSTTGPAPQPVEWRSDLSGVEGYAELSGEFVVHAAATSFDVELEADGLPAGEYGWEVAAGSCADPGNRLGTAASYATLTADEVGAVTGSATVAATLTALGEYHGAIFRLVTQGEEEVRVAVACGDLERQE
jgi:hypothetical protein